jgi:hypothetical protein
MRLPNTAHASGKRQIIEGVIGQLKDLFGPERHRAKTLGGLLARLAAKVGPSDAKGVTYEREERGRYKRATA